MPLTPDRVIPHLRALLTLSADLNTPKEAARA